MHCPQCGYSNPVAHKFCGECGMRLWVEQQPAEQRAYTPPHLAHKILQSRSALEGERKQVTVLFCDIANSTPLAARIGADRMHKLLRLGGDVAKDMIAVRIAPDMRLVVVGSPGYFERHARPRRPQDLTEHDCIGLRLPSHGGLLPWEFKRRGKVINAHISGRLVFSARDMVAAAALGGQGLAWVPDDMVSEYLADGRLVSVLDDWSQTFPGYHAYYATRSASPALGLVVEALRQVPER